jgi:hypothetical protein
MRCARFCLLLSILLLTIPVWAQQAPTTALPSDPQAIALVQAAINALGGSTAIGQAQSWTLQGVLEGPMDNGNRSETIEMSNGSSLGSGTAVAPPRFVASSLFIPALVGAILLKESQDQNYSMQYRGLMTIGIEPVTVITFSVGPVRPWPAQTWCFDRDTGLPVRVQFGLPSQIGQTKSFSGLIDVSDYRSISGALYPFRIVTRIDDGPGLDQVVTMQSVSPDTTISPIGSASPAGGVR